MGQELSTPNIPPRKVVKTLAVGQEVEGIVKRVTEFGAFVDIGVGRDGLVHVSEMSTGRVIKASDVVQEGQQIKVWIKELDRDKNRISLSMIAPGTMTLRDLEEGMILPGRITRLERYGAFVDIGIGRDGMLHVKEMGHAYIEKPEDVVKVGDEMQVQVVGVDHRRGRVDLSIKELIPPPQSIESQVSEIPEALDIAISGDAEESFVSQFELAFQEARGNSDDRRRDRRKKSRSYEYEEEEEDIISRTFAHHRKSKGGY